MSNSIANIVKRIQINEQGDIILGTPCMVGFLNQLAMAEIDVKKIFNLSKEGLIIELKPFPKEFPEDQKINALAFFQNQLSIRNIMDHQKFTVELANKS
jgi:hypothetical protein